MKVHYSASWLRWFPDWTEGVTIGEHVFIRGATTSNIILLHESKHVEQFRRFGFLGFVWRYFRLTLRHGYHENPLEIEAREFAAEASRWSPSFIRSYLDSL